MVRYDRLLDQPAAVSLSAGVGHGHGYRRGMEHDAPKDGDNTPSKRQVIVFGLTLAVFLVFAYVLMIVVGDENDDDPGCGDTADVASAVRNGESVEGCPRRLAVH
ncbi:MAG: hypothetical protein ABL966_03665 [Acidimicrobiales bacterium]